MFRLFIILAVIFIVVAMIPVIVRKYFRKLFSAFIPDERTADKQEQERENVIYKKDEIIVLKGEAGKKSTGED